jgi:hypothetical protein
MQPKVTCTQTVDTKVCTVGQSPTAEPGVRFHAS